MIGYPHMQCASSSPIYRQAMPILGEADNTAQDQVLLHAFSALDGQEHTP